MKLRRYWSLGVLAVCIAAAIVFRQFAFVAWYPVGMSAFLALSFGLSLFGKPLCLVFAEAIPPHVLPDGAESYCRKLTAVWCFVLVANGLVATATVFAPRWVWFAWNCALSYGLMGSVILAERIVRRRAFAVTFNTSGSTSTPKKIAKTFESLAAEVAYHSKKTVQAALAGQPVFLATIEPGHMYGTLWRVLLPRLAGCTVDPEIILTPESLLAKMRTAKHMFLVTTPSFLERFCAYADQYDVPQNCVEIVTSGALLAADVSAAAKRVFGIAPIEIFGSTETGGVAWRRQGEKDKRDVRDSLERFDWTVFDPVKMDVDAEGRLKVDSPFSFTKGFVMGDGVELSPDKRHFKLLGRLDRLVKIAEQRVSLPEMEENMRAVPGVREAALVKLEGPHGPYLGAVVVFDFGGEGEKGGRWEGEKGRRGEVLPTSSPSPLLPFPPSPLPTFRKRKLALDLRQKLLPIFPKGTVPKKYRFVHELPRNAQGKILASELVRLFEAQFQEPFVLRERRTENSWEADMVFDPDAPYFQGHFPGFPILAGVVQLGTAHHFAEQLLKRQIKLKTVKKMKFTGVVRPGDVVHLTLAVKAEGEVAYTYSKGATVCASGVMQMRIENVE